MITALDKVFAAVVGSKHGLTREEIATETGLPLQTVNPRVHELIAEGSLHVGFERRQTEHGRSASVLLTNSEAHASN